ncbi:MAG TPA: hypothetical protein VNF28_01035 [Candidatus Binataceae bacterium]|nr:hypothetical protein [Candidatus Binataceae bacterium]
MLSLGSTSIAGTDASDLSISANLCNGASLNGNYNCYQPGNLCTFVLTFAPKSYGDRAATIDFTSNYGTLLWQVQGIGGIILIPARGTVFPITQPGNNGPFESTAPIEFGATGVNGQTVTWKTVLHYQTSGSVPNPAATAINSFSTVGKGTTQQTYTSEGGHLSVKATVGSFTDSIPVYIVGPPGPSPDIPYSDITSQLTTLYSSVTIPNDPAFSPATPGLMSQVVQLESSLLQFSRKQLYGVGAFWPRESAQVVGKYGNIVSQTGSHIGLTQVPVSMPDAWDWLHNTQDGVNLFQSKLSIAYNTFAVSLEASHPGLPGLTPCQLEEMALALYGPFAGGTNPTKHPQVLNRQYYTVHCNGGTGTACTNGSWQWILNPAAPETKPYCALCYVSDVRSRIPPTGGSASSCPATPSIPLDPLFTTPSSIKQCKAECPGA